MSRYMEAVASCLNDFHDDRSESHERAFIVKKKKEGTATHVPTKENRVGAFKAGMEPKKGKSGHNMRQAGVVKAKLTSENTGDE